LKAVTVQQPKNVEVDLEAGAAYIYYGEGTVAKQRDVTETGSVSVDFDAENRVIGIEVLWIDDPAQVAIARQWALEHGLAFPWSRDAGELVQ
jgi:uncharacterized protein YuzE